MKTIFYSVLIIAICNLQSTCDWPLVDRGVGVRIQNNTQDTITWYIPSNDHQISNIGLPDHKPLLVNYLSPSESFSEFLQAMEGKNYFDELPTDSLYIFILDYNDYMRIEWDSIVKYNIIKERLSITEEELETMDYIIEVD